MDGCHDRPVAEKALVVSLQAVKSVAETICLLAVAGSAAFFAYDTHQTQVQVRDALGSANTAVQSLNSTLEAVNRPCGTGKPCGTLATINKAVTKAGDAVVTTQREERATIPHVLATVDEFKSAAGQLSALASTGVQTAQAATETLGTAQTAIKGVQPLLGHADATVEDLDNLLRSPDLTFTMDHVEGMTASGDKMLADAQQKEHELLHPTKAKGFRAFLGGVVLWIHRLTPPIF